MRVNIYDCDVCGLPDIYEGTGDGIGSCGCPRCDGGEAAAGSQFCSCPDPDEDYPDYAGLYHDGVEDEYPEDEW